MPLTDEAIDQAVARYWREYDRYGKLAEFVGEACRKLLDDNVVRGSVQWRAKNPDRLRAKLQKNRNLCDDDGCVFTAIKDFAGARVTTYVESDRERIVEFIRKRFDAEGNGQSVDAKIKDSKDNFYRATHCTVLLKSDDLVGRYENLKGLGCEVQVCSLLAHVYNEIEHDLRYKPLTGELSNEEESLLDALGHLTASGDTIVNQTLDAVSRRQERKRTEFEDEYDFVVRMRSKFPDAPNFATNAGQLYEACIQLGLRSPEEIDKALNFGDTTAERGKNLAEKLAKAVNEDETQLEVDPDSSDQLLVLLVEDKERLKRLREAYPSGRGKGRATRLISLAKRLETMTAASDDKE